MDPRVVEVRGEVVVLYIIEAERPATNHTGFLVPHRAHKVAYVVDAEHGRQGRATSQVGKSAAQPTIGYAPITELPIAAVVEQLAHREHIVRIQEQCLALRVIEPCQVNPGNHGGIVVKRVSEPCGSYRPQLRVLRRSTHVVLVRVSRLPDTASQRADALARLSGCDTQPGCR